MGSDLPAFTTALATCSTANSWSAEAKRVGENYARATLLRAASLIGLKQQGIDTDAFERLYRGLSHADRRRISQGDYPESMLIAIAGELNRQNLVPTEENRYVVNCGVLVIMMALLEFGEEDFAAA